MIVLALLVCWSGPAADRPLLCDELPFVALEEGQELRVVGRYQSLLGDQLVVEDSAFRFHLDPDRTYRLLRSPELRSITLELRCRVLAREDGAQFPPLEVIHVERGPPALSLLRTIASATGELRADRRIVIVRWGLRNAREGGEAELRTLALELFRSTLRYLKDQDSREVDPESVIKLFAENRQYLEGGSIWVDEVTRFAARFAHSEDIADGVRALGFVKDRGRWRSEEDFLAGIGMIRVGDRVLDRLRHELEQVVEEWREGVEHKALLRGLTNFQYETYVEKKQLHEGMKRREVLKAWGYPSDVTWIRRDRQLFEGWFYPRRKLFLLDGLLFKWNEQD